MTLRLSHSFTFLEKIWFIYSQRIHKALINDNANFYLKPNDIISHRPTLFGYHELLIETFIDQASSEHSDFFLDLGANIGLTSSMVGNGFQRIDCVEPNELVFNILKTILALNIASDNYHCHMIGLGKKDETLNLLIPKDNFGGAFIKENNNIAIKRESELSNDYLEVQVEIVNSHYWLKKFFWELKESNQKKGIIKVDVEGYEEIIFDRLIATLPKDFDVIVIMKNWFEHFPANKYKSDNHDLAWYYFKKKKRWLHSIPVKFLGLSSSYLHELVELTETTKNPHDIVCQISAK